MTNEERVRVRGLVRAFVANLGAADRLQVVRFLEPWLPEPDAAHAFVDVMLDAGTLQGSDGRIRSAL